MVEPNFRAIHPIVTLSVGATGRPTLTVLQALLVGQTILIIVVLQSSIAAGEKTNDH